MKGRTTSLRAVAVVTALVLAVSACAGDGGADDDRGLVVTQELLDSLPASQAAFLADGTVSDSEMEQALLGLVGCLEGRGFPVTQFVFEGAGGWSIEQQAGQDEASADAAAAAYEDCAMDHVVPLDGFYAQERAPTEEDRERERRTVVDCLNASGFGLSDEATWDDIRAVDMQNPTAWSACRHAGREAAESG